ncbi:UNKNOWN [Stylonychia lemnae]|uniref:Uncharacterized protein n=1 Tax=Stylonychia lemnae TaxID=5949 RepID=A0A078A8D4_STYLE|nr:UNKNOWN [Stylonychia lemnae]|eukprot:CDW77832.1 UNKNOWN [Stylonychia lemnae]
MSDSKINHVDQEGSQLIEESDDSPDGSPNKKPYESQNQSRQTPSNQEIFGDNYNTDDQQSQHTSPQFNNSQSKSYRIIEPEQTQNSNNKSRSNITDSQSKQQNANNTFEIREVPRTPLPKQDNSDDQSYEEDHEDVEQDNSKSSVERQLQNDDDTITIFDPHPELWIYYELVKEVFGLNERKRRRLRKLGLDEENNTQPIQDEDLMMEDNLQDQLEIDGRAASPRYDQNGSYSQDQEEQIKTEREDISGTNQLINSHPNSESLVNYQNNSKEYQRIDSQKQKSVQIQEIDSNNSSKKPNMKVQNQLKQFDSLRQSLQSRDGNSNTKPARQNSTSSPPISSSRKDRSKKLMLNSKEFDNEVSQYSPDKHQYSNSSPQTSSFVKQSSLKQSSIGSLPNTMQWSNQMEKTKQRAENRLKAADKTNAQRSQTYRNSLNQQIKPQMTCQSRLSQQSSRIRIGGGIQQRKQAQSAQIQPSPQVQLANNQTPHQIPQMNATHEISQLRSSVEDVSQLQGNTQSQQMTEEQFQQHQNMIRREKLKNYMIQQRFIQSPYAAHLNFKTFENFFDVEICGGEEKGGKTTYKLKKINPQKKNYQQQMLMWMLQNQHINPQMVMNAEMLLNQDPQMLKIGEENTNLDGVQDKDNPVGEDMILAEGFLQRSNNQQDRQFFRGSGFPGMMRNYSQPTLSGQGTLQRASKTAENNGKCNNYQFLNSLVRRNINGMSTDIQHLGMSSSQGFLPPSFQNSRQITSGSSERILRQKQDQYMKMGKQYFSNNVQSTGSIPSQMTSYQSTGNLHRNFRIHQQQSQLSNKGGSNMLYNEQNKLDNENQQYNYTIDLASLNQQQIRQTKTRSASQGVSKDGVNHNFINNNINININHNFTPSSNQESGARPITQQASHQGDPNKIIINTGGASSMNPIKQSQMRNGLQSTKSQNFIQTQQRLRMQGSAQNPPGFNFQAPPPLYASTVSSGNNRNMMNNNFMNAQQSSQPQLNYGYASNNTLQTQPQPSQSKRPMTQGGMLHQRSAK